MAVVVNRRASQADGNRAAALRLLRRHRLLSRTEIAQRSGLSEASVSRIIQELEEKRLVTAEGVARSTGGRPAVRLQLDESYYRSAGVDIHEWETRMSLGTLSGRLTDYYTVRTPPEPLDTLDAVLRKIAEWRESLGGCRLKGVGVSVRGLVNSRGGVVERGNDPAWSAIAVREYMSPRLGLPVHVENNVRAAAFAEYHYGSPDVQDAHCLLFVKVDEGVGVSMIVDGSLFYGQHMAAGEFGQMVIAGGNGSSRHDRPGCLEKLASDGALCDRYRAMTGSAKAACPGDVTVGARRICHAAMAGEAVSVKALRETARWLGIGISNVVWGLDPDAVVVDGVITEAWQQVGPVIQEQFADGREFLNFRNLVLRPSTLRSNAAIIGAAALPFQPLFGSAGSPRLA